MYARPCELNETFLFCIKMYKISTKALRVFILCVILCDILVGFFLWGQEAINNCVSTHHITMEHLITQTIAYLDSGMLHCGNGLKHRFV